MTKAMKTTRKQDDKSNIVFVGGLRKSTTEDTGSSMVHLVLELCLLTFQFCFPTLARTKWLVTFPNLDKLIV